MQIIDIEDPVEDSSGFVYQKASILNYLRGKPRGETVAPVTGR